MLWRRRLLGGSWMLLIPCGGLSRPAPSLPVLASLGESLMLAAGSSVLLGVHALLFGFSGSRCGLCLDRPALHVLDLLLDARYCDGDWFLFLLENGPVHMDGRGFQCLPDWEGWNRIHGCLGTASQMRHCSANSTGLIRRNRGERQETLRGQRGSREYGGHICSGFCTCL